MAAEAHPAGQLDGALQDRRSLPSNSQRAIETDAPGDSVGGPGGAANALPALPFGIAGGARFDAPLPSVPDARHGSQQTPERGVPGAGGPGVGGLAGNVAGASVPGAGGPGAGGPGAGGLAGNTVGAGAAGLAAASGSQPKQPTPSSSAGGGVEVSSSLRFDASLRSVPNARHDSQQPPESGVPEAGVPGAGMVAGAAGAVAGGAGAVVPGASGLAGNTVGAGAAGLAAASGYQTTQPTPPSSAGGGVEVSSSLQFGASLPSVPNARHDSQQTPESGALASAVPAGVYAAAGVSGLARIEGDVGVPGIRSATHFDASLPARRFLPSNGHQAVEMGVPGAAAPGIGVAVDAPPALSGALQFDASLRSVPNARHDSQQTPESGVPGPGGLPGNVAGAGAAGLAGNTGLAAAGNPQPAQPIPPSSAGVGVGTSAGVGVGTASVLSPALQFDGSLHDRRFFASNQQGSVESGSLQAVQVTQASQIPPSLQPVPPQLNTIPTQPAIPTPPATPTPLASAAQPALAPQLAAPLFSLASAGHGEHVMTLRVAPDDLGPLTVRAHIDAAGVRIELFAPGDAGRDAVRHVLPELRRSLEDSGASLSLSSQNSPPDAGRDPGQGSGRDPGQGTGHGSGPGSGTRDPDTRTQGPGEQGPGEQGTRTQGPNEQGPGEAGHEGADAQPQLPPGVVRRPGSPNRLDILA